MALANGGAAKPAPPAPAPAGLGDRLRALRDRLFADPRFQRWASRFPLTRGIARRRARSLFDLCAGFVYSQIMVAAIRLDLVEQLADGPLAVPDLAARLGLPEDGTWRLVRATAALGLIEPRGADRFGLGELGAVMRANPEIAVMVKHHALLYQDLADPVALLEGRRGADTALGRFWAYTRRADPTTAAPEEVAGYSALMAASQPMIAAEVLDAVPVGRFRRLLDVGGGEGAFLIAAATRVPALEVTLFDLPAVAERARARFDAAGLGARATALGGDMHRDPLPTGYDAISLVRVIHDHDDNAAQALLGAVRRALPPGGTLVLAEPMSDTRGAEPIGDAYFGFYLMAMGSGRPRTVDDLTRMLHDAGFDRIRRRATLRPMLTRVLTARPAR